MKLYVIYYKIKKIPGKNKGRGIFMKKFLKIFGIILGIIIGVTIVLGIIFFTIDYNKIKNNQLPIFCIKDPAGTVMDGGTIIYWGLGYKVIDFHTISGYDDIKIGPWSMQYNDFDDEIEQYDKIRNEKIEKIQSSKVSTIEIKNLSTTCNLDIDEMYQILTIVEKANFIPKTCKNKIQYYINYNSEVENQRRKYGIETCGTGYHITSDDGTEAILSTIQNEQLDKIINKYFE